MTLPEHYHSDVLFFFDGRPVELSLYQTLYAHIETALPDSAVKVQKTQISFSCKHLYAAASLPVRRQKHWPKTCLIVTIGLPYHLCSPRVAVASEPYPGRWTHHILISQPEQIDRELLDWLRQAHDFAQAK